jgi:ribosomal subunit interface protein
MPHAMLHDDATEQFMRQLARQVGRDNLSSTACARGLCARLGRFELERILPQSRTGLNWEERNKMIPFQITFRDFSSSDAVWVAVQNRVEKLETFFDRIVKCDVVISAPHRHRHADRLYHIQVHISIGGEDIHINREPEKDEAHTDIYVAIRDAFDAAERKLQDRIKRMRNQVKTHADNTTPI